VRNRTAPQPRPRQHRTSVLPSLGQSETGGLASPRSQAHEDGTGERQPPSRASVARADHRCRIARNSPFINTFERFYTPHEPPSRHPLRAILEPSPDAICRRPEPGSVRATARTCAQSGRRQSGRGGDYCAKLGSELASVTPGDDQ
jgi:hypothetical protein